MAVLLIWEGFEALQLARGLSAWDALCAAHMLRHDCWHQTRWLPVHAVCIWGCSRGCSTSWGVRPEPCCIRQQPAWPLLLTQMLHSFMKLWIRKLRQLIEELLLMGQVDGRRELKGKLWPCML